MENTRDIVIRTEQKVDDMRELLKTHLETDCSTQKELNEHKQNHKYWITTMIAIFILISGILIAVVS